MARQIVIFVIAFLALTCGSSTAQQSSPKPMSVAQVLQGMSANIAGISSFQVPVHIVAHVKKGMFSIPFKLDGNRYFKLPDRNALKVTSSGNAQLIKALEAAYALMDSPTTWQQTHTIVLQAAEDVDGHHVYPLWARPKRQSNVDHLILDVDTTTYDPVRARWFLRNGSTVIMHMRQGVVAGKYRLAQHDDVVFNLPSYNGSATVDYGTFAINVPVDDSVFANQ